jgi:hypothetical protein
MTNVIYRPSPNRPVLSRVTKKEQSPPSFSAAGCTPDHCMSPSIELKSHSKLGGRPKPARK